MKKYITILITLMPAFLFSQVRIGGDSTPRGMLDINHNSAFATMGLVLPCVSSADTIFIKTTGTNPKYYPMVVTPNAPFANVSESVTDDEGIVTTTMYYVPQPGTDAKGNSSTEAPGGTIVYDKSTNGMRYKKSSKLGNWSGNIIDATTLNDSINYRLLGGADFKMIKASTHYYYSVGINATDMCVYTTGNNASYRTGKGISSGRGSWQLIIGEPAKDVSAGYNFGMAVLANGDVYTWGVNSYGRTGQGVTAGYTMSPKKILLPEGEKALKCEASIYNALILTESGKIFACGSNALGANGNGTTAGNQITFQQVNLPGGMTAIDISMGFRDGAAIGSDGKIYVWGNNSNSRLGLGAITTNQLTPVALASPPGVVFKLFSINFTIGVGISTDNKMYLWGGPYGNYVLPGWMTNVIRTPTEVTAFNGFLDPDENIIAITLGRRQGDGTYLGQRMLLATDKGKLYASGNNNDGTAGTLGVVNITTGAALATVQPLTEIQNHGIYQGTVYTHISIFYNQSIICTGINAVNLQFADYTAYGVGSNTNTQLGNGPNTSVIFSAIKK
ncbi:MAG: hypothetical protein FWD66_02040 [Paludibacter sp.]|nr:hypothetical protein [Paludibacter sp.]